MLSRFLLCIALATLSANWVLGAAPEELAKGKIADASLQKLAPKSGFITDHPAFAKLWKAWRPEEEMPEIDFGQDIVIVGLAEGPNLVMFQPKLQKDGNLKFVVASTRMAGPGFGYRLVKVSREGVKTINCKPILQAAVQGTITIPASADWDEGQRIVIKLFKFNPLLADVSAELLDEKVLMDIKNENDMAAEVPFAVGQEVRIEKDRRYYITVFGMQGKTRTHIGETEGRRGLKVVLPNGDPSSLHLILRQLNK